MGIETKHTVQCDICDKQETTLFKEFHMPNNWANASIRIDCYISSNFIICSECRSKVYDKGFFKMIFNKILKGGK